MKLRLKNHRQQYAEFGGPGNHTDKVVLESDGLWRDRGDEDFKQRLGPWTFTVYQTLGSEVRRHVLAECQIHFDPGAGGSDWTLRGLKVTARYHTGNEEVLVDQEVNKIFDGVGYEPFAIADPTPPSLPDPQASGANTTQQDRARRSQDVALAWELITHLHDHRDFYSQRVLAAKDPAWFAEALDAALSASREVRDRVDGVPVAVSGQYLVFPYAAEDYTATVDGAGSTGERLVKGSIVSLPTRGLLAEAQLGSCNACEKRDVTRFWKWEESPCAEPPAIEDVTPGFRGQVTDLEPTNLPSSVV
jgi:hypothetical protein